MTGENPVGRLGEVLASYAAYAMPEDADVWPAVVSRLRARGQIVGEIGHETTLPTSGGRRWRWSSLALTVTVVAAVVVAVSAYLGSQSATVGDNAPVVPTPIPLPDEGTEALIDDMVNRSVGFSGAVLVSRGEDVLLSKGYGIADRKNGVPNTPRTVFAVGGGTFQQQFTAAAVLQLQEKGLLDVNEPVGTYLPDFGIDPRITVHHLLTDSSGIPDLIPVFFGEGLDNDELVRLMGKFFPKPLGELVNRIKDEPLGYAPGDEYSYSRSDQLFLSLLIEETSGQALEDYLQDHIFKPLGMADTRFCDTGTRSERRAIGYETYGSETPAKDWAWLPLTTGRNGTALLCTTTEDMYLWAQGLRLGKVINEDSIVAMFTPYTDVDPAGSLGYGWWLGGPDTSEGGRRRHGVSTGFGPGGSAHVRWYPAEETFVVVLSNAPRSYEIGDLWETANVVAELAFGAAGE